MASCKFQGGKCKGPSDAKAHMRHNDISAKRRAIASKGNKHIDVNKSKYNFSILGRSYEEMCRFYDERIAYLDSHGNKNKRKDRVTMLCIEIPVPADLPRGQYRSWFFKVSDLLMEKYGSENFVEGTIHVDEEHEYRNPETMELVLSRVHGHFMIVPAVDGKLNAKQLTMRKEMKSLNREVDAMTRREFNCVFMTGTKKKSYKTVSELKSESEYAEYKARIREEEADLAEQREQLRVHREAIEKQQKDLEEKEARLDEAQEQVEEARAELEDREKRAEELLREADEMYRNAVRREQEVADKMQKERTVGRKVPREFQEVFKASERKRLERPNLRIDLDALERKRTGSSHSSHNTQDDDEEWKIPFEFLGFVSGPPTSEDGMEI